MMELTEVILKMRSRIDIFPGPLRRFFYEIRGYEISHRFILANFRKVQEELEREMPSIIVHPVSFKYPTWRKVKFAMSPVDIERALLEKDPEIYGLARSWLPFFQQTTGLRFPPSGKNDFLYRVYLSLGQQCTEAKQVKNTQRAVVAYGNRIIRKEAMQNVIKGGVVAVVEGISKVEKQLPKPAQHQLEDYKKALDKSWNANFFERNNQQHQKPPKEGHKPVRCLKCDAFLTSGPGTPCRKCGWKP